MLSVRGSGFGVRGSAVATLLSVDMNNPRGVPPTHCVPPAHGRAPDTLTVREACSKQLHRRIPLNQQTTHTGSELSIMPKSRKRARDGAESE